MATRKLQTMGCKTVIVTLGEKGAVFARALDDNGDGQVYHVKPLKVDKVVDTTVSGLVRYGGALAVRNLVCMLCSFFPLSSNLQGAGDAFIGALAHCLANYPDAKLGNCIAAANRVAAWSVQIPGTQSSFPRADEIELPADLATLQDQWGCV